MARHWAPPRYYRRRRRLGPSRVELRLMVLGGIAIGLAWSVSPHPDPRPPGGGGGAPPPSIVATGAIRVIDGDTFDHGGVRVRIADIDTPELRSACAYERNLAAQAKRRLGGLLGAGPFELRPGPGGRDEDRYGRKLRIVVRHGRSLGDQLVAEGLARTWSGRREPWC